MLLLMNRALYQVLGWPSSRHLMKYIMAALALSILAAGLSGMAATTAPAPAAASAPAGTVPTPSPQLRMYQHIHDYFNQSPVRSRLKAYLRRLAAAPHPFGSTAQAELARWLNQALIEQGVWLGKHTFTALTPHRSEFYQLRRRRAGAPPPQLAPARLPRQRLRGSNILAKIPGQQPCTIMLGSHYDTKMIPHGAYYGANDSASSSAALLVITEFFKYIQPGASPLCSLVFIWFDGEESVLDDWNEGQAYYGMRDHTYGSTALAQALLPLPGPHQPSAAYPSFQLPPQLDAKASVIKGLIILDMIGSPGMQLTPDHNSDPYLRSLTSKAASLLGLAHRLGQRPMRIEDDHLPFVRRGIRATALIDFYHLRHWHQPSDREAHIDYSAIIDASKIAVLLTILLSQS